MNCERCENFNGYSDEGIPYCAVGEKNCPFGYDEEKEGKTENNFLNVVVDMESLKRLIGSTVSANLLAEVRAYIKELAQSEFKDLVERLTREAVERMVNKHVEAFMKGEVTIGGGWREPVKTMTRDEYVTSVIQDKLENQFDPKTEAQKIISETAQRQMARFTTDLRDQVNREIKRKFDESTRNELANSVVSLLVDNETYKRLQNSMANLASGK
jgi:hypothetical protein